MSQVAGGVALSPSSSYGVSKELWRTVVENEVGNVDTALVFVEGGGTLDAVGDVELTTDKAGDSFGLEGPETIGSDVGYGIDNASGEREETVGCEVAFATGSEPKELGVCKGANEGRFFALDDSYGFERIDRGKMLPEKALAEEEVVRDFTL